MNEGPALFARFAFPPNALGYCGPADVGIVAELASGGAGAEGEMRRAAMAFAGAWPYLELIAGELLLDPLDVTVVEAYWLGHPRLAEVDLLTWGNSVDHRFRDRAGWDWERVVDGLNQGGVPTHAFHVFCVYPWVGLLRSGAVSASLEVLDRCRIRWGTVVASLDDRLLVESQPLTWEAERLGLGPTRVESVDRPIDPRHTEVRPGDLVAMHWNYVCQVINPQQLTNLRRSHDHHLAIANRAGRALAAWVEG